jgi:TolB-like protein
VPTRKVRTNALKHILGSWLSRESRGIGVVKSTGDGLLAEFASVVDAVRCAVEIQRGMVDREPEVPEDMGIRFRIGINLGDVIVEEHDIFGDGVNVAARLETLAEPGGVLVSNTVYEHVRDRLPFTFDDMGEQQVKNIARPVQVYRVRDLNAASRSPSPPSLPLPDKPSIAVLAFQNMSGDPEQEYFADGMVEEIITALSRIKWLFVIARNSSFAYKSRSPDLRQIGRELGVRYVLEGSVRKASQRVHITGQLIDAPTATHLWADRFDGSLEDVFELQDKVAQSVAGVIGPTVQAAEMRRSSDRPTNDVTAYDLYLRAVAPMRSGEREKERYLKALGLLGQAIERDPRFGPALAAAAFCHHVLHVAGWTNDAGKEHHEGIDLAGRALRVAGDDAEVLGQVARVNSYFGEDLAAAISLIDRALGFNPSFALGWQWSGWLRLWAGEFDIAIGHFETSMRLNPLQGRADYYLGIGMGYFFCPSVRERRGVTASFFTRGSRLGADLSISRIMLRASGAA